MQKVTITIDLNKLKKDRIEERTYTNKDGKEVTVREYKLDVVPLKEKKDIKEGDTWKLVESHFVCESQTKEEREAKADTVFVGKGIMFEDKGENAPLKNDDLPW